MRHSDDRRRQGIALLAAAMAALPAPARAVLRVVATTTDVGAVLAAVGGDRVRVVTLARGYLDPHYLEPKPSFVVELRRADVLAYVGLQLEIGWLPRLVEGARNRELAPGGPGNLAMSAGIDILEVPEGEVTRAQGDVHPEGNPHYWLDPRNLMAMARTAEAGLARVDAAGAEVYRRNRAAFVRRLEAAVPAWEARLAPHRGTRIVCYHKTWEYLLRWLGLEVAAYIENRPGIPPTPQHLQALEQTIRTQRIPILLAEVFVGPHQVEGLAQRTGAALVLLPPSVGGEDGIDDVFALFDRLTLALAAALRKGAP